MRFKRLHIPAFGPFTNLELTFPTGKRDFHVIYGRNEAGKSSLLRAIRDLLFGIHGQSADNFLHDYKNLRLQGEIVNRAGVELTFQRRKGNKNTLLDGDGNSLPDSALAPFLGTVDAAYFSSMFGLGNKELHEGADALLRGEGEVGKALFSASMGGTPIQKVLESLNQEAQQLFKGKATANVTIRPAAKKHKELLKQSRDAIVRVEDWTQLETDWAQQDSLKKEIETAITDLDAELEWIARCEGAWPTVGRLIQERQRLSELPDLPNVAGDFVQRAREARDARRAAMDKVESLEQHITSLEEKHRACAIAPHVMAQADALDALHQDLGVYRNRREALEDLRGKLIGKESLLRSAMKELELDGPIDALEGSRIKSSMLLNCREAADKWTESAENMDRAVIRRDELKRKIDGLQAQLKVTSEEDLTPLREALATAAEATEANKLLGAGDSEIGRLKLEVTDKLSLVTGVPGDFDQAAGLPVPSTATIRKYSEERHELERDLKDSEGRVEELSREIASLEAELERLQRRGELPSEELLREARAHRDHGWALVLAEWKGAGTTEVFQSNVPLEEAYPQAVLKADEVVDEMRSHAEAVAQAEEKRLQIRQKRHAIGNEVTNQTSIKSSLEDFQSRWTEEWAPCGLSPKTPVEMEDWREAWIEFRDTLKRLKQAEQDFQSRHRKVENAKQVLATVLKDSNQKDFTVLFEAARQRVADGERREGQQEEKRDQLLQHRNELAEMEREVQAREQSLESALEAWRQQCKEAGLPESTSCRSGIQLLEQRKQLIDAFDHWKDLNSQVGRLQEALTEYEGNVRRMAETLQVRSETIEGMESALWQLLDQARRAKTQSEQLSEQMESNKSELESARTNATQAERRLGDLLKAAHLDSQDDLEPLLANLEQRQRIQTALDNSLETLSGLARGQDVEEFVTRVQAEDPDELSRRKSAKENDRALQKSQLGTILNQLANLKIQKENLEKAGDKSAGLNQEAEALAASLRKDAARYLRLKLATHFLENQIENFRQQNQGPLLEASGEIFKQITLGAFAGLAADYSEDDVPVIIGRRSDGSQVPIEGLSEGSRDQLFLALRLAALKRHLADREPMPLILDDLLITFDDERSRAILPQLSDLAQQAQVFLFTHHKHLVDLCATTLSEDQFTLHELAS